VVQLPSEGLHTWSAEPTEPIIGKPMQTRQPVGDALLDVTFEVDVNGILRPITSEDKSADGKAVGNRPYV
jgi:hypothetical protein